MGWASFAARLSSLWSSGGFKLGTKLGEGLKGLSTAISNFKWSNIIKVGAAGGIGYTIYHAWDSATGSIAEATGLSQDNVQTILFFGIGLVVIYVAVVYITNRKVDEKGSNIVIQYPENNRSQYGDSSYDRRGYDGSYYHQNVRSYQNGYYNDGYRSNNGYRGRNGGGRR